MIRSAHPALTRALCLPLLAASLLLASSCFDELEQDPRRPVRVQAVFDPVTSTIPLPNAAAIQIDGTLPLISAPSGTAQAAFYDWLDGLQGWLPETSIEVPFNGLLQADSVTTGAVRLVQIAADGTLTQLDVAAVDYEAYDAPRGPAASRIFVRPAAPLEPAQRYGVIVTTDILGENGEPVLAPAAIFFGLNDGPLVDEAGRITVPQLKSSPETAQALEALVRPSLAPLVDGLDQLGLTRQQIASAFTWRTNVNTFTVLDPATATIPLPNTLALDPGSDGLPTFPRAALPALVEYNRARAAGETVRKTAQIVFDEYLDDLHGWPNTVAALPVEVPLSGPVNPATLTADNVQLWSLDADGVVARVEDVEIAYVAEGSSYKVALRPAQDFALNTDYFAFITTDVRDPDGFRVLPPAAMALALQPEPLLDEAGQPTVAQLDVASATAATGVQRLLQPFVQQIEAETGLSYRNLASVWTWYTWRDPFIVFDPLAGDIPFPNAFLIGDDGTVNLPVPAGADPLTLSIFNELNTRTGFSSLADGWVSVAGAELDPATVTLYAGDQDGDERGSLAMASVPGALPELLPQGTISVEYVKEYRKILFRLNNPLAKSTLHAAILSNRIKGLNGLAAKPTPIFVMLGSEFPLYTEEQGSLIAQLPPAAAPALEDARIAYERLFLSAQLVTGDRRPTITGAFAFTTDNATAPLQRLRARAVRKLTDRASLTISRACDLDNTRDCDDDLLDNTTGALDTYDGAYADGLTRDLSNIQQVQWAGQLSTVDFLLDGGARLANWSEITEQTQVGVTLYVPKEVPGQCEAPFRVVIVQHGLGNARLQGSLGLANDFASSATCLAVVAPDAPLHGGRSAGSATLHPPLRPDNSGTGFLGSDFVASKHNFMQSVADLIVLNQLIRAGALESLVENTTDSGTDPMFDTSTTAILGTSLGGIFSTDLVAIDPDINIAVLTVAPGKLTYYLTEPSTIGADILAPLNALGIVPGTFAFEQLISLVQWVADHIDPAIFARHLRRDMLPVFAYDPGTDSYTAAQREGLDQIVPRADVLVQMALNDPVAPNISTAQLARVIDVPLADSTYEAEHAFLVTQDPASPDLKAASCARRQAAAFLRAAIDDESTAIPDALKAANCVAAP